MFGWFKSGPKIHYQRLDDVVWPSSAAREQQIPVRVRRLLDDGLTVIVCAHSMTKQGELRKSLGLDGTSFHLLDAHRVSAAALVPLCKGPARLIVTEFGDNLAADEQLLQRVNDARLKQLEVEFHTSLDEPTLRAVTTPALLETLKKLGLKDDEPIQHRWVTRAIATAREKSRR